MECRWGSVPGTHGVYSNKALYLLDPVFTVTGTLIGNDSFDAAIEAAFDSGDEARLFERGNVESLFDGAKIITSEYQAAPALHLAMEPMAATAHVHDGQAEIWLPTQAPAFARAAVAKALDLAESDVILYPLIDRKSTRLNSSH